MNFFQDSNKNGISGNTMQYEIIHRAIISAWNFQLRRTVEAIRTYVEANLQWFYVPELEKA
jgi:hypothetical protein